MRTTARRPARLAFIAGVAALVASPVHALAPKGGGSGGGKPGSTDFSVEVAVDGGFASGEHLWVPTNTDGSPCFGWAAGMQDLAARWRVDGVHLECQDLTTSTGSQLTDDIVVRVLRNSAGDIDRIQVTGQDVIGEAGLYHRSDVIPVALTQTPSASGFTIHVHAKDVQMWKCNTHLLKKQTKCDQLVGTFSLDDMIYVPNSTTTSIESTVRYAPDSR